MSAEQNAPDTGVRVAAEALRVAPRRPASKEQLLAKKKKLAALHRDSAPPPAPNPEDLAIEERRRTLQGKTVISTPIIDFGFLDEIGILGEFTRLTERVGFSRAFWEIPSKHTAYVEPTIDFLASLALEDLPDKTKGISFRLLGSTHRLSLAELAQVFHFKPHQTEYLGYTLRDQERKNKPANLSKLRAAFWYRITGQHLPTHPDPRVGSIIHPALRFICRILGSSLCARGESSLRPRHEELKLIATMLRPDDQIQRPHLMLEMVNYWLSIVNAAKPKGIVAMGSYVTCIAAHLGISLHVADSYRKCDNARVIDREQLKSWGWIGHPSDGRSQTSAWVWKSGESEFPLPIRCQQIDFSLDHTWRMQESHAAQQKQRPAQQDEDVHMEDAEPAGGSDRPADRPPHATFTIPPDQWAQLHSWMQETHAMHRETQALVRHMQTTQMDQSQQLRDMATSRSQDRARIDDIYARQTRLSARHDELHDLFSTMRAHQLGEGAAQRPADDTAR